MPSIQSNLKKTSNKHTNDMIVNYKIGLPLRIEVIILFYSVLSIDLL